MNEEFQNNLVNFLKLFKNRPYHLAKYLIDNSALTKDFYNKISKSDKLENNKYFTDITEMNDFYNSILNVKSKKSVEEITKEANIKMDELIKNENFEEAAKLRDYMTKNKIKRLR
jgi:protein-arginine kinase activator protein McsA